MTTILKNLFRGKKSHNKENEQPTELERGMSYRRSGRLLSSSGSRRERSTRFHTDDIAATAPYHTVTAPKLHKGPMSCPGGYKDDYRNDVMNRSFDTDIRHIRDRRERHDYGDHKFRNKRTTWETSEYGSGDPSPIGNYPRSSHYNEELDDSDDQGWTMNDQMKDLENNCRRYMRKFKHAEERHMAYKSEYFKMKKAKEETEKAFVQQIEQMRKQHKKDSEKIRKLEEQLDQLNRCRYANIPGSSPYNFPLSGHHPNRMSSLMPTLPPLPCSTATPSTSAIGSITGAGEALTEQSELSLLQPFESSFPRPLGDDMDETKNFRAMAVDNESFLSVEAPRAAATESSSTIGMRREDIVLNDGCSTTSTETAVPKTERVLKRSASTGALFRSQACNP